MREDPSNMMSIRLLLVDLRAGGCMQRVRFLLACALTVGFLFCPSAQAAQATAVPGPPITGLEASSAAFYPLVRDEYLDEVSIRWDGQCDPYAGPVNPCASYSITDSGGAVVRQGLSTDKLCYKDDYKDFCIYAPASLAWNGLDSTGRPVPTGIYSVTVTANGASASIPVTVATMVKQAREVQRIKWPDTRRATRGCWAKRAVGSFEVNCSGGQLATATFGAALPDGAKVSAARLTGSVLCCSGGRLTRTVEKPKNGYIEATVSVTGYRGFRVKNFYVDYVYPRVY